MLASALAVGGCDSNGPHLAPGQFVAETTGSVEGKFEGSASFAVAASDPDADLLSLKLVTGSFRPPRRDYEVETGFFLGVPFWDGRPGTFRLVDRGSGVLILPTAQSFGLPTRFRVESGTVVVDEVTAGRVAGSFGIVAVDELALEVEGVRREVRTEGEFIATPSP